MISDEVDEPTTGPWLVRAKRALRKRWVQITLVLIAGGLSVAISAKVLAPKKAKTDANPNFLFCPKCESEERYDQKMDGEPCIKCSQEPVGKLVGRAKSIKDVSQKSPWKWFYLALTIESLLTLATVVYLLSRASKDLSNTFYVFYCPHCSQRLRFRHVSLRGLGQCSRCKRPVRFPAEDQAVLEEDLLKDEERRAAEEEAALDDDDE